MKNQSKSEFKLEISQGKSIVSWGFKKQLHGAEAQTRKSPCVKSNCMCQICKCSNYED